MKSVQRRSFFWSAFFCIQTEYGDLLTLIYNFDLLLIYLTYLDTLNAVKYCYFQIEILNTVTFRSKQAVLSNTYFPLTSVSTENEGLYKKSGQKSMYQNASCIKQTILKKLMGRGKKIKQNWTGPENFYIYFA